MTPPGRSTPAVLVALMAVLALLLAPTLAHAKNYQGSGKGERMGATYQKDKIISKGGNDRIDALKGNDYVDAGAGDDTVNLGQGKDVGIGGSGNDSFKGIDGEDTISGGGGNDSINSGFDDDAVDGGAGNDKLATGTGNDVAAGGPGNDFFNLGTGNDTAYGDDGFDELNGIDGNDSLFGGNGGDWLKGGDGDDLLQSDDGTTSCPAGTQFDATSWPCKIDGGAGNDTIVDGPGNRRLSGDAGDDTIRIGAGQDLVYAEEGTNTVYATIDGFADAISCGERPNTQFADHTSDGDTDIDRLIYVGTRVADPLDITNTGDPSGRKGWCEQILCQETETSVPFDCSATFNSAAGPNARVATR